MDELTLLLELLKDYDLISLIVVGLGYSFVHKKINVVDRAVNQRPAGNKTISDEVTEINNKIDLFALDLKYVKKEVDAHRDVDEAAFLRIEKDIRLINNKIT